MNDPLSQTETQREVVLQLARDCFEGHRSATRGPAALPAWDRVQAEGEPDDISLYGADPPWI